MQLATINKYLRSIGLVLTIFIERKECRTSYSFTLETARSYDARIPKDANTTRRT